MSLSQCITKAFIMVSFVATIPSQKTPQWLAVYLCKDGEGSGTCGQKKVEPTLKILRGNTRSSTDSHYRAPDHSYLFAPLFEDGNLSFPTPSELTAG